MLSNAYVSLANFNEKFQANFMDIYGNVLPDLIEKGWLRLTDEGFVQLTKEGLFLGNEVFEAFLI